MPIRISSAINGFRRAGVAHPSKPTVYPDGFFSDDQIKQLKAEPRLAVEFGDFETADPAGASVPPQGAVEPDTVSGDLTGADDDELIIEDGAQTSDPAVVPDAQENVPDLEEMNVPTLREIAKDFGIDGYTSLKKAELIEAIKAANASVSSDEA